MSHARQCLINALTGDVGTGSRSPRNAIRSQRPGGCRHFRPEGGEIQSEVWEMRGALEGAALFVIEKLDRS